MAERYSVETFMRIYNDDDGWFYEIRPDSDGLDCVEVRYSEGGEKSESKLMVPPKLARLMASALMKIADETERRAVSAGGKS